MTSQRSLLLTLLGTNLRDLYCMGWIMWGAPGVHVIDRAGTQDE